MSKSGNKVLVVGAGPGGLSAAMILASKGYDVQIYEKAGRVGGRNAALKLGDFTFDTGPTFLMMLFILEDAFKFAGRDVRDYLDIRSVDPFYRLVLPSGKVFYPTADRVAMREQIERLFTRQDFEGYERFISYEGKKFAKVAPCLQIPYGSLRDYTRSRFLEALPYLDAHKTLHSHLGKYFPSDDLKLAFTFQAKYLGMSPWACPATFSIISYIEHTGGVHHPIGGLCQISEAMAKVALEHGAKLHLNTPVEKIIVRDGKAVGIQVNGEEHLADYVVLNADFGHAMNHLVDRKHLKKWTPETLEKKGISCSTFMIYLGLDKRYDDIPHHNILFSPDYKRNVDEITGQVISEDPSIYIQNACVTDPTLAPEGKSTLYLLVPIANNRSGIDWEAEKGRYRDKVLELVERRGGLKDLRKHIEVEKIITPTDWEKQYGVYRGATFNLAHTIDQMLYFRPHNVFEEFENCFLTGGGTHPGSGLPTIYESGIISAGQILRRDAWYLNR